MVDEIKYEWYVNDILTSNFRHVDTINLSVNDVLKFKVFFEYGDGVEKILETEVKLKKCINCISQR